MEVIESKNIKEPVILLKMLSNNSLLVVDSQTTVRFFDPNTVTLLHGFKVKIRHKRYKESMVAFSNDAKYFASISPDGKKTILYNGNTKEIITQVDRHHGEVSCIGIDPSSRFLFSCGDDGKTFTIDLKRKRSSCASGSGNVPS